MTERTVHGSPALTEVPEGGWLKGDTIATNFDGQWLMTLRRGEANWYTPQGHVRDDFFVEQNLIGAGKVYAAILVDRPKLPTARGSVVRCKFAGRDAVATLTDPSVTGREWWITYLDGAQTDWCWGHADHITDWTVVYEPPVLP